MYAISPCKHGLVFGLFFLVPCRHAVALSISVQPIQVCNNGNCADPSRQLFVAETQQIWSQAGIGVDFLPWNTFDAVNNPYYDLDVNSEFLSLILQPAHGQNVSSLVIDMWFVNSLDNNPNAFGVSILDYGYVAISDSVFDWNGGLGRIDTIAHELGHTLNLDHYSGPNIGVNLMASGGARFVPNTINNIYPNGLDYDQLTPAQIALAQQSRYVTDSTVPEPTTLLLFGSGVGMVAFWRKRLRGAAAKLT